MRYRFVQVSTSKQRAASGLLLLLMTTVTGCDGERPSSPPPAAQAAPTSIALAVEGRSNAAVSVAAFGHTVAAVWTASTESASDIYLSVSTDGGATFGAPVRVNDVEGDARASGEQAARVVVGTGNAIHVAWPAQAGRSHGNSLRGFEGQRPDVLAGRHRRRRKRGGRHAAGTRWRRLRRRCPRGLARRPERGAHGAVRRTTWEDRREAGTRDAGGPRQDIFHASWKGAGERSEQPVQASVCFCCKTAVATAGEHVYAAWRHIYPGSLRDIAVARSTDNGATFGTPMRVSEDGWKIDACPDDGPSMVADGHGGIHVVWPTLVGGDTPRKGIFYSTLSGDAFAPRIRLDIGRDRSGASADCLRHAYQHCRCLGRACRETRGASSSARCRTGWLRRRRRSAAMASAIQSWRRRRATG